MKLRLFHAKILSAPDAEPFDGELHIEGGKIVYAGSTDSVKGFFCRQGSGLRRKSADERFLQCARAFRHVPLSAALRTTFPWRIGCTIGFSLWKKNLTQDDVYWGTMLQIAEYVRNGITCVADMYFLSRSSRRRGKKCRLVPCSLLSFQFICKG